MSEYATAGIESSSILLLLLVEIGAGWHVDCRCVIMIVVVGPLESSSFAWAMSLKRVYLAGLRLEIKYLWTQKAATVRCRTCSTHILLRGLATSILSVMTAGSGLFPSTSSSSLGCLRICIVVRNAGLGECWRPPDAGSSLPLRGYTRHFRVFIHLRCLMLLSLLIGHLYLLIQTTKCKHEIKYGNSNIDVCLRKVYLRGT